MHILLLISRMDVPAGSVNVAWYAWASPRQKGSAVIGGHFDKDNTFVFYNLIN